MRLRDLREEALPDERAREQEDDRVAQELERVPDPVHRRVVPEERVAVRRDHDRGRHGAEHARDPAHVLTWESVETTRLSIRFGWFF